MTPERQAELVEFYAKQLQEDLAYAAPEMWPIFIKQAMEDLAEEVLDDQLAEEVLDDQQETPA